MQRQKGKVRKKAWGEYLSPYLSSWLLPGEWGNIKLVFVTPKMGVRVESLQSCSSEDSGGGYKIGVLRQSGKISPVVQCVC